MVCTCGVCTMLATAELREVTIVRHRTEKDCATSGLQMSSSTRRERGYCSDRIRCSVLLAASRFGGRVTFSSNRTIKFCKRVSNLTLSICPSLVIICPTASQCTPPGNTSFRSEASRIASAARMVLPKPAMPWTTTQPSVFFSWRSSARMCSVISGRST